MKLIANLDTEEYYLDEPDPNDSWDAGNRGIIFRKCSVTESDKFFDTILDVQHGDTVHVLIEHYRDGSTFGSYECMEVRGIFKSYQDANRFSQDVNTDHGYFGHFIRWIIEDVVVGR